MIASNCPGCKRKRCQSARSTSRRSRPSWRARRARNAAGSGAASTATTENWRARGAAMPPSPAARTSTRAPGGKGSKLPQAARLGWQASSRSGGGRQRSAACRQWVRRASANRWGHQRGAGWDAAMAGAKSASPWRQAAKTLPHSQEMFPASRLGWARSVRPHAQRSSSHGCPAGGGWQPFGAAARATEPVPSEAAPRAVAVSGVGRPRRGGESAGAMLAGAIARVDAFWMPGGEIPKYTIRRGVTISGPKRRDDIRSQGDWSGECRRKAARRRLGRWPGQWRASYRWPFGRWLGARANGDNRACSGGAQPARGEAPRAARGTLNGGKSCGGQGLARGPAAGRAGDGCAGWR